MKDLEIPERAIKAMANAGIQPSHEIAGLETTDRERAMSTTSDPEIPAQPIDAGEIVGSAARLIRKIGDHWTIDRADYSRGPVIASRGHVGHTVDCVTIQLSDDTGGGAVATFINGRFWRGFVFLWCVECIDPGFRHAATVPTSIGYRDLCTLVSEAVT